MRATEEAAFWLYSAKDWIDGMNAFVPDRLKAYALSMACELLLKYCNQRRKPSRSAQPRITSTGSWKARWTGAKRCACTLTYH